MPRKRRPGVIVLIVVIIIFWLLWSVRVIRNNQDENQIEIGVGTTTTDTETKFYFQSSDVAPGTYSKSIVFDGSERSFLVHIPSGYDASKSYPVVFGFHGGFGSAENFEASSALSKHADERGFIVVYGQGLSFGLIDAAVWNAGACCGRAVDEKENVDDVGYVRSVLAYVQERYHVNSDRVYMTGMSNGGMLVQRLACEATNLFAGAASVSGTMVIDTCTPNAYIPMLIIHGTEDKNVPYEGGVGSIAINPTSHISIMKEFSDWGLRNQCSGSPKVVSIATTDLDGKSVDSLSYENCTKPVTLYRVNGGEHEWPGAERLTDTRLERSGPTKVMNASQVILDFFEL
jgi:polyhydroxybutyrate depolymerase